MRTLFILAFSLFFQSISFAQNADFFKRVDGFFKRYVTSTGQVRYNAIKEKPELLNTLYTELNSLKPNEDDPLRFQAFYINAYNLAVIKTVVDNYPISSPMEVSGFFESVKHSIAREEITLNHLENKILRKKFKEPRFHFVLVCGAVSCPPIVNFAYTPDMLNVQMEQQANLALNNPQFIRVQPDKKTVELSEIFKWYKEDFTDGQSVIEYLNQFKRDEIPSDYQVKYYSYNWMLNDTEGPGVAAVDKAVDTEPNLNLQTYTAGTLLRKGQMDFTLFNTLYTETRTNWQGQILDGYRTTFATSLLQWTVGLGNTGRFNLGFDLSLRGAGTAGGDNSFGSINRAFQFTNTDSTSFGINSFGPRIKFSPFKGNNDFTIQSSLLFSPADDSEGLGNDAHWIEWDRYIWWNQFFYTYTFGEDRYQIFAEVDLLFRFARRDNQINHVDIPANLFFSYFPTPKITLYAMTQYVPRFAGSPNFDDQGMVIQNNDWVLGGNATASGAGFKYQFTPFLNIELLYTNFWSSRNNGLGETFNIGVKYLVL